MAQADDIRKPGAPAGVGAVVGTGVVDEALRALLWPQMFRAPGLALRRGRLAVALVMLAITFGIGELATVVRHEPNLAGFLFRHATGAINGVAQGVVGLEARQVQATFESLIRFSVPLFWERYGLSGILLLIVMLVVWSVGGCAICRLAAVDAARRQKLSALTGLRFALDRWTTLLTAVLVPVALWAVLAGGVGVALRVLLAVPGLDLVAGAGFGVLLGISLLAVLVLGCFIVGLPLVIPAIACEDADWLDALQAAFAYVLTRPLRLLLYGTAGLLVGWVTLAVFKFIASATVGLTVWTAGALPLGSDRAAEVLERAQRSSAVAARVSPAPATTAAPTGMLDPSVAPAPGIPPAVDAEPDSPGAGPAPRAEEQDTGGELSATGAWSARLIGAWMLVPLGLVGAYGVSYFFSASTMLYLLLRRLHEGTAVDELWMPRADQRPIDEPRADPIDWDLVEARRAEARTSAGAEPGGSGAAGAAGPAPGEPPHA